MNKNRPIYVVLLVVCGLAAAYFILRAVFPVTPSQLAATHSPTSFRWDTDAWYWLEAAGQPGSRVMRASGSSASQSAAADRITSYCVAAEKLAWSAYDGKNWSITTAASNGSSPQQIWTGQREPRGLCVGDGKVFWLEEMPAAIPDSGPLPPLGGTVSLISLPLNGGAPTTIATLMEPKGEQVVGVNNGQVYVAASRPGPEACTLLYQIPLAGGLPHRIAGEVNMQQALMSRDGTLYWTAGSREASNSQKIACVNRLSRKGDVETLSDWLPSGGKLYETDRGVCYVDAEVHPAAWPVSGARELPRAYAIPPNFSVLAVGDGQMLLQPFPGFASDFIVYRIALP